MSRSPRAAVLAAVLGDLTLAVAKFIAAVLAQSAALLAEAIHSVSSAGSQGLLLLGAAVSRRVGEDRNALAFARERYYWGSTVVFAVCAVGGAFSVHAGFRAIVVGASPGGATGVAYVTLAISAVFVGFSMHGSLREFLLLVRERSLRDALAAVKDPTVPATMIEDAAAAAGLAAALAGLVLSDVTGSGAFDGAAAVVVGLVLAGRAAVAAYRARKFLLGDAAARSDHDKIRRILALQPGIERVVEVAPIHLAPDDVILGLAIDPRQDAGADDLERIVHNIDYRIREAMPHIRRVYIEAAGVVRFLQRARRGGAAE